MWPSARAPPNCPHFPFPATNTSSFLLRATHTTCAVLGPDSKFVPVFPISITTWNLITDNVNVILMLSHFKSLHPPWGFLCLSHPPGGLCSSWLYHAENHFIIHIALLLHCFIFMPLLQLGWKLHEGWNLDVTPTWVSHFLLWDLEWDILTPLHFSTLCLHFLIRKIKVFHYKIRLDNLQIYLQLEQSMALSMRQLSPHLYKASSSAKLSSFWIKIHVHPSSASVLVLWENNAVYFADPVTVLIHNILLFFRNGRLSFPACLTEGPISPNT